MENRDDEKRDAFLQEKGYRVLRFWNHEVSENCFGVLERIYEALTSPHRISRRRPFDGLRGPARLLRLPLKGGVIEP